MPSKLIAKLGIAASLSISLSGCIATEKLDDQLMRQEDAKWVADEQFAPTDHR